MRKTMQSTLTAVFVVFTAACAAVVGGTSWPCFHGQQRTNKSVEEHLLKTWPKNGPLLLWTASGIGHGYSSVAVADNRIFTAGMIEKDTYVIALDLNGTELWRSINGESWQASAQQRWAVSYAGSRGTPTVDGNMVYHLSDLGRLSAFDVKTGSRQWYLDIMKTFNTPRPKYGFSESLLIHGDRLFCCPGGAEGYIVALDKKNGRTLWTNTTIPDPIGYASLVPATIAGVEQVIGMSARRIFAVRTDNGHLLWQYDFGNQRNNNAADIIVHNERVYASSGYGKGSVLIHPQRQADGRITVKPVWSSESLDNHHGGVILLDDHLYGSGHEAKGWTCLKLSNGQPLWQAPGKGSLTYADGRLYCLDEKGSMFLVQPNPEKWQAISSFTVPRGGQGAFWAHPVICGGRLYVRHSEKLYAYNISAAKAKDDTVREHGTIPKSRSE